MESNVPSKLQVKMVGCLGKKDVSFIWSLWHKSFVVNIWKVKANHCILIDYLICKLGFQKILCICFSYVQELGKLGNMHFHFCISLGCPLNLYAWRPLSFEMCLFNQILPSRFKEFFVL